MEKEYDFSRAEQGKFYRPHQQLEIPIYLEKNVQAFFAQKAADKKVSIDIVVNKVLKKEIEVIKEIEV